MVENVKEPIKKEPIAKSPKTVVGLYMQVHHDISNADSQMATYQKTIESIKLGYSMLGNDDDELKQFVKDTMSDKELFSFEANIDWYPNQSMYQISFGKEGTGKITVLKEDMERGIYEHRHQLASQKLRRLLPLDTMIFTALVEHDVLKKKDESDTDNMIDEIFKEYKEETKDAE